jgi:hypothetical protein
MNMVFGDVARYLQSVFLAGDIDRETMGQILTILACALSEEGWYAESMEHSVEEFKDWPVIVKALRVGIGD